MLGASARLSCLHTPVETSTPPKVSQAPYRAFPPPAKTYSLRCSTFSGQTRFAGLCPDLGNGFASSASHQLAFIREHTLSVRELQTAGRVPSDSLHCSISVRRSVLHFCNVYRSAPFSAAGYSTPWVSTRMDWITTGFLGLSFIMLRGTREISTAFSTFSVIRPKAA